VKLLDRMPPLDPVAMTDAQRRAADELTAGPRGGVKGPFIPLLRSPELMDRLQKVGEYLRYHSVIDARISEFAMLLVSRHWTQQFEWGDARAARVEGRVTPRAHRRACGGPTSAGHGP
jgi:4-carboxymuconolactone decarboxylase